MSLTREQLIENEKLAYKRDHWKLRCYICEEDDGTRLVIPTCTRCLRQGDYDPNNMCKSHHFIAINSNPTLTEDQKSCC